jgi:hypothetical protein
MQIVISWDSSTNSAPAAFVTTVNYVVQLFDQLITDPITVNIDVGWGEINGSNISPGALGESETNGDPFDYSIVRLALFSHATSADDRSATSFLPDTSPVSATASFFVASAQEKALGFLPANDSVTDGWVGFSKTATWDYSTGAGPVPSGQYYFVGIVEHEITEVLGRIAGLSASSGYSIMDLFRYSAAGVRNFTTSTKTKAYFSVDNGATDLGDWNITRGADPGDWAANMAPDAFLAFTSSGVANTLTTVDERLLDVIGYTIKTTNSAKPAVEDFNGDGFSDVLLSNTTGQDDILQSNGNGTFTATAIATLSNPNWTVAGVGDFNGDGKADLFWRNSSTGDDVIWTSNGDGTFAMAYTGSVPTDWTFVGTGDFNNDGKFDILWRNSAGQNVIWQANGDGTFAALSEPAVPTTWAVAGIGDFNGDGKSDILWHNAASGDNVIWQSNGDGTFSMFYTSPVTGWSVAAVGDFNGDGRTDVLWRNASGQDVIWTSNGDGTFNAAFTQTVSTNWSVAGVGDYNGDGKADIFWRDSSGNDVVWQSNGDGTFNASFVTSFTPDWSVTPATQSTTGVSASLRAPFATLNQPAALSSNFSGLSGLSSPGSVFSRHDAAPHFGVFS